MNDVLFRSENLAVRARMEAGSRFCVVTFDSYTDLRTLDRPGFGEEFFHNLGIDAVHVISRDNDWYQYPELLDAAGLVRDLLSSRERVMSYGSSMGGYGAIRFGGIFGAHLAAAFSPQFSIDPAIVPFETRWIGDAARIDYCLERRSIPFAPRAFIFYDPHDPDIKHVDLYRSHTEVIDMKAPLGGHPCISILSETGVLRPILVQLLETGEAPDFLDQFRTSRLTSPEFFYHLSVKAKRRRARALLAERAFRLSPRPMFASHYGEMLAYEKRFEEARELFRWALEKEPDNPVILYRCSDALELEGDLIGAAERIDRVFALITDPRAYRPRQEHLAKRLTERWSSSFGSAFSAEREPTQEATTQNDGTSFWRVFLPIWLRTSKPSRPAVPPLDPCDYTVAQGVDPDILLTTVPAPPQFAKSVSRHLELLNRLPTGSQDLLLLGDSLVEWWPDCCFEDLRVFNFGIAGDRTQHLLWRLLQVPDKTWRARCALLVIGTNNISHGDTADALIAGVRAVLRALAKKVIAESLVVLEIPPMGVDFNFRANDRLHVNEELRGLGFPTLNVDQAMIGGSTAHSRNYAPDGIHFSEAGYTLLSNLVRNSLLDMTTSKEKALMR